MGCFSKCCAKTHLPVLMHSAWGRDAPRLTHVVVLQRHAQPFHAEYDGYGLHLDDDFDDAKFVLQDVYKGEKWEDLPESGYECNQGIFHDKQFVLAMAAMPNGFSTYDQYWDALREYEEASADILPLVMKQMEMLPPETLYMNMSEYFNYLVQGLEDSAQFYVDRHPDVLDWLPQDKADRLVQAQLFTQAMDFETAVVAKNVLAPYMAAA